MSKTLAALVVVALLGLGCEGPPASAPPLPPAPAAVNPAPAFVEKPAAVVRELRFAPGARAATVSGSVIRGERHFYQLTARAGQRMQVTVSAAENNAAFVAYVPGYRIVDDGGSFQAEGATLPKAGDLDDATRWQGPLPATGEYLLVVGGTRGNATYELAVSIP
ncbi:MAG: hypothetical protein IT382_22225 [Deltaproteobacteria bacterium]|nr:hypothetical protein [Deltaproteobacteria bacterium]